MLRKVVKNRAYEWSCFGQDKIHRSANHGKNWSSVLANLKESCKKMTADDLGADAELKAVNDDIPAYGDLALKDIGAGRARPLFSSMPWSRRRTPSRETRRV